MEAYCRGEAAGDFETRPDYVAVAAALPAVGGGYVATGSVDRGTQGNPPIECRFDTLGRFEIYRRI